MKFKLKPYQKQGIQYLVERGGGFVWDQPGLGKTIQGIVPLRSWAAQC
jgi:SNF2 family DNA or RNA helicase